MDTSRIGHNSSTSSRILNRRQKSATTGNDPSIFSTLGAWPYRAHSVPDTGRSTPETDPTSTRHAQHHLSAEGGASGWTLYWHAPQGYDAFVT